MSVKIIRWDDVNLSVTFKDSNGDAINITWYTVFLTVKNKWDLQIKNDTDSNAIISVEQTIHSDPTNWKTTISIPRADTKKDVWVYFADLQLKDASDKITSTQKFEFEILPEVTQRTS